MKNNDSIYRLIITSAVYTAVYKGSPGNEEQVWHAHQNLSKRQIDTILNGVYGIADGILESQELVCICDELLIMANPRYSAESLKLMSKGFTLQYIKYCTDRYDFKLSVESELADIDYEAHKVQDSYSKINCSISLPAAITEAKNTLGARRKGQIDLIREEAYRGRNG